MIAGGMTLWNAAGIFGEIAGAGTAILAAVWIGGRRERFGAAGAAIVVSLFLTAFWSLAVAAAALTGLRPGLFEVLARLGWLLVIYRLFSGDGRHDSLAPIRPLVMTLAAVELLQLTLELTAPQLSLSAPVDAVVLRAATMVRLLVVIGELVLLHNLYVGASLQARRALRWPALALGLLWGFDLNLYTVAYLGGEWPAGLAALRGLSIVAIAVLMAIGAAHGREELRFRPSRRVAFQSVSLLVISAYFAAMIAGAQWLSYAGGYFAVVAQYAFLSATIVLAGVIVASRRLRGWLRVTLAKHLFQHRYDYRAEWLRFTRTIGKGEDALSPIGERAIQAVADIADSPAGLLLAPGEDGELTLAARWKWPAMDVPANAMTAASVAFFETTGWIVDLEDVRAGRAQKVGPGIIPQWLLDEPRAWAVVPLIHFERLAGLVVLSRPSPERKFDWEDFDLLRVVGQQLASYLAEHAVQAALAEASRFDDFHRRIAFVMHDIKNLASQLSLLTRNAELHAENPAFRADMLVTLRNSADKLNILLARLSRYVSGGTDRVCEVEVGDVVRQVAAQFRGRHSVLLAACEPCTILGNRESLEQVLVHLVQNAIDASEEGSAVLLGLTSDGIHACIEVVDSGCGMTPEFVRTRLFKPFVSSKQGGFGIGAFEARELVRAMQGRLEVESREGLGSRFLIRLPLAEAEGMLKTFTQSETDSDRKVA
jgi:putative PEP-CTERM system histidine kinase